MHIEPGLVQGAKLALSYATAAGAAGLTAKMALDTIRNDGGLTGLAARAGLATVAVFCFFQVLPHYPVGVSEVHVILGATLFLLLGAGPAAIGLAMGLLLQGLFFAPTDLPQYFANVTTLIVPLWAVSALAKRVVPSRRAFVDLDYGQVAALSAMFQTGVVGWVAFWAFYGQGAAAVAPVASFGAAYLPVIALETVLAVALLGLAKSARGLGGAALVTARLHHAD